VDTRDELLARILDSGVLIKKRKDELRQTTRNHHTRDVKCTEVDGGFFEHLLWTATSMSFKYEIKLDIKLTLNKFSFFVPVAWSSVRAAARTLLHYFIIYVSIMKDYFTFDIMCH